MTKNDKHYDRLYHGRLLRTYLEYIKKKYPTLDIDALLDFAGLSKFEINDDGFWYTQEQADRFHEILNNLTGNENIAREVGRYGASSESLSVIKQYVISLMDPSMAYELLGRIGSKLTRGTKIEIKRLSKNSVEAIYTLNPGVNEKPYQCKNRYGLMEAVATFFTGEFANVDHKECIHEGYNFCRYIISWDKTLLYRLRRLRNILMLIGVIASIFFLFLLPPTNFLIWLLSYSAGILAFSFYDSKLEVNSLKKQIQSQGQAAEQLIAESDKRYRDADLVQEIGRIISTVLDIDDLLLTIMKTIEKYFDYDRGMVLLSDSNKKHLVYQVGYGYSSEQEEFFRHSALHLDKPKAKGPFVLAFKEQKPYLVNNIKEIVNELSERSRSLVEIAETHSFICVPIVYENESLGVLSLDNKRSTGPPKQSDLNLLMGIAPQIAISIMNARSFERLQASEEKYRDLVESANSIIMRLDTKGKITYINKFGQGFYGYKESEIIGREVLGFLMLDVDESGNDLSRSFTYFLNHPDFFRYSTNVNILRNGEPAWISWSNKAIYDKDEVLVEILCVGNDITARKKAEDEKQKLEMQLQRSQKMEAIGQLAGGVAHDLNNILSGIVSYPEILMMELPKDSPLTQSLEIIKKSGEKAAAIVQDLLTLARRGVNATNVVNINKVVSDFLSSPEYNKIMQYNPNIHIEVNLESRLMNVLGSELHLSKTVMNLISNAAEAMPDGGVLAITTENRYIDIPTQGYDLIEEGEYVILRVKDTGIGISQEDLKRVFEPFYSKKAMGRSGTGLGMAIIWSTVKDHNGFIDVKSTVGEGTCLELYLPITRQEAKTQEPKQSIEAFRGTEKVLVVDDVFEQREIARRLLENLGYTVGVASSGKEAVEYLKNNSADLIMLDMIMEPDMDGLETYKEILKIHPGQKAIIVSGFSETDRVKGALSLGAGSYVKKPYLLQDIAKAVRNELDKKE